LNIILLEPRNRSNLATIIRSGQNFNLNTIFVIGGFVREQYKGNIHKFSHQMNTQDGIASVTLIYFETLDDFLVHLPAQTTLVVVETIKTAINLVDFEHPKNASYIFGSEGKGIRKEDLIKIENYFADLQKDIPKKFLEKYKKVAHLSYVKIDTPKSLNLGVCASIVMYDRICKM